MSDFRTVNGALAKVLRMRRSRGGRPALAFAAIFLKADLRSLGAWTYKRMDITDLTRTHSLPSQGLTIEPLNRKGKTKSF